MIVLSVRAAPPSLEGWLSRWLIEVSPGLFVGKVNAKVRGELWKKVLEEIGGGEAVLAWPSGTDSGVDFALAGSVRRRRVAVDGCPLVQFEPGEYLAWSYLDKDS